MSDTERGSSLGALFAFLVGAATGALIVAALQPKLREKLQKKARRAFRDFEERLKTVS